MSVRKEVRGTERPGKKKGRVSVPEITSRKKLFSGIWDPGDQIR